MKNYLILIFAFISFTISAQNHTSDRIQPFKKNPSFWQYKSEPILLIGGSTNDNLFQNGDVLEELDLIKLVGGNYVRNTLSSRDERDEWPYWRSGERFNLDKFNKEYWEALDNFLKLSSERNIIVQLEIWSYEDFTSAWDKNPWNPNNNQIFTGGNSTLSPEGFENKQESRNNFFLSVPKLNNDSLLLIYQKLFVDHLLTISFKYDNIIYSITDNINPRYSIEWGWFWSDYIRKKAVSENLEIEISEALGEEDVLDEQYKAIFNHPEIYSFVDISQNSLALNEGHWEKLIGVKQAISKDPRPVNYAKVYGGQLGEWTGGPSHGIERFWRNLIAGSASSRFEAEPFGLGLSLRAQMHIKSACLLGKEYNFFSSVPDENSSLILEREEDEAYLAKNSNNDVVVYFTDGGQIILDFTDFEGDYKLKWLNLEGANWHKEITLKGGGILELTSPYAGNWVALLSKVESSQ